MSLKTHSLQQLEETIAGAVSNLTHRSVTANITTFSEEESVALRFSGEQKYSLALMLQFAREYGDSGTLDKIDTDAHLKSLERRADLVTLEDKHIIINGPNEHKYEILASRCDSIEKILAWVYHLSEKTWMTQEMTRRFIQVASKRIGFDLENTPV